MINIREAKGQDAEEVAGIFRACYGESYAYPQFYDPEVLRKLIYSDDALLLVAQDSDTGKLIGTASVIYSVGANSDLAGEFGRLAVLPEARRHGAGKELMSERLSRVADRLHIALIDARVVHPYTLKIAGGHGFKVAGFVPMKMLLSYRESIALLVQHMSDALRLRNNHPRIIPEIYQIAAQSLTNCGLDVDVIVDESAQSYPRDDALFKLSEMETEGYYSLLRIERGRVRNREIFGPHRLHYGFFKLKAHNSHYLIATIDRQIAGAVGFTVDPIEKAARLFELISLTDEAIGTLLFEAERVLREEYKVEFMEVDVSAYAPRMQRTLLELNFVPAAYVPALVFHDVERLDAIKMVRITVPIDLGPLALTEEAQKMADIVMKGFDLQRILPRVSHAVESISVFRGLNTEQTNRLAAVCSLRRYEEGSTIFDMNSTNSEMYLVIEGRISITIPPGKIPIGYVESGECLGETAFLLDDPHSVTATALSSVELAVLSRADFSNLARRRPDIGLLLYRNLATGLGQKLRRADQKV